MKLNANTFQINLQQGILYHTDNSGQNHNIGMFSHDHKMIIILRPYNINNIDLPPSLRDYRISDFNTDCMSLRFYDPNTSGDTSFYQVATCYNL